MNVTVKRKPTNKILVANADPTLYAAMVETAKRSELEVVEAEADAPKGIVAEAARTRPSVLAIDVGEMGFEAAQALRRRVRDGMIVVVVGDFDRGERELARETYAADAALGYEGFVEEFAAFLERLPQYRLYK
jgi:DNA-binding NarL/FixJ family response regulator